MVALNITVKHPPALHCHQHTHTKKQNLTFHHQCQQEWKLYAELDLIIILTVESKSSESKAEVICLQANCKGHRI